jgi:hypothetical protein
MEKSVMKHFLLASIAMSCALAASEAEAALINNPSFESTPEVLSFAYSDWNVLSQSWDVIKGSGKGNSWAVFSIIPGWQTFYGPGIELHASGTLENPLNNPVNAVDGNTYVELDAHFSLDNVGHSNTGIFQLVNGLINGSFYDLSFWYRARTTETDDNGLNVYWASPTTSLAQSTYVARFDYSPADNNHENWVRYSIRLQASDTSMLLGFGGDGNANWKGAETVNGSGKGAAIDAVNLEVVSSPGAALIFCLGITALAFKRRQRQ